MITRAWKVFGKNVSYGREFWSGKNFVQFFGCDEISDNEEFQALIAIKAETEEECTEELKNQRLYGVLRNTTIERVEEIENAEEYF